MEDGTSSNPTWEDTTKGSVSSKKLKREYNHYYMGYKI
jgi:hypothetical protein